MIMRKVNLENYNVYVINSYLLQYIYLIEITFNKILLNVYQANNLFEIARYSVLSKLQNTSC